MFYTLVVDSRLHSPKLLKMTSLAEITRFEGMLLQRDFIKRNAKAFSLDAIVDVRRRLRHRHEMICFEYL